MTAMDDDEGRRGSGRQDNDDDESSCSSPPSDHIPTLDFESLKVLSALGRGAKGVVFLVRDEERGEDLALKVISRALIEKKAKACNHDGSEYKRVSFEQRVLRRLRHPLFPRLRGVLHTENLVGYAIDYCPGRDLSALRKRQTERMFSDDVIRFYAAQLVLALEYLHNLGIVYRDLKPENIMIQKNGHIMIVDFDLSTKLSARTRQPRRPQKPVPKSASLSASFKKKKMTKTQRSRSSSISPFRCFCNSGVSPDDSPSTSPRTEKPPQADSDSSSEKSNSFVGTEEYVAPEIVSGNGHDFAVDWWSLGVVLYEMLYGVTPFRGTNRKETFYRILTKSPELTGEATPLRNLIRKLLEKDPTERIGVEGIKGHDFFAGIDWDTVLHIARPPFLPDDDDHADDSMEMNQVDVESVVREIFGGGEIENNNNNNNNNKDEKDKSVVAMAWVQGLNPKPGEEEDQFLDHF